MRRELILQILSIAFAPATSVYSARIASFRWQAELEPLEFGNCIFVFSDNIRNYKKRELCRASFSPQQRFSVVVIGRRQ